MVRLERNQILLLLDQNGVELFCLFSLSVLGQVFLDRFEKYYEACESLLTIDNIVDTKPIRSANGHVLARVPRRFRRSWNRSPLSFEVQL